MYIDPSSLDNEQPSYKPTTPLEWAMQALLQANTAKTKAMAKMKLLRGVALRPGRDSINLFAAPNCEAALAFSRGQVMEGVAACKSCKRESSPFTECIVLDGYLNGSCSTCHYNSEGTRCSFRSGKSGACAKRVDADYAILYN